MSAAPPILPNFHQVTPWLYRGGQPDEQGIAQLRELGIATVVSLRWGKRLIECERAAVLRAGMRFISMPLDYWAFPKEKTFRRFLELTDDQSLHPVFVHCLHGSDRTGLLIAVFRIARQGWDVQAAYEEMKACGFHRIRMRHFKWILFSYARTIGC